MSDEEAVTAALRDRVDELERMKARTWTSYEMAEAVWTFTFNIHRDDTEEELAHELAHAVQRFRWGTDDPVHSQRHAALAASLSAALDPWDKLIGPTVVDVRRLESAEAERDALRSAIEHLEREWRDIMNYFHADALRALLKSANP